MITFQESADGLIKPEVNCAKMQYRDTKNPTKNIDSVLPQ